MNNDIGGWEVRIAAHRRGTEAKAPELSVILSGEESQDRALLNGLGESIRQWIIYEFPKEPGA